MSHRLPSLNGIRSFEASARHLSFKMAAGELGVTAGAVSQQVKALETALGVALFRRLSRGLLLTEVGEAYLPALSDAFRTISRATEELAPALPSRKLRIGLSPALKKKFPPRWPGSARELKPYVGQAVTTEDVDLIRTGRLDGVLRVRRAEGHGLSSEMIAIIRDGDTSHEVHYIVARGLAGCRQSLALVRSLEKRFPYSHNDTDIE